MSKVRDYLDWAKPVIISRYLWLMLAGLFAILLLLYLLMDRIVMPAYTRHNVAVTVPDIRGLMVSEADSLLRESNLDVRHVVAPFVSSVPRNAIVEQDPEPFAAVKPGRRVYLHVNSGQVPMVEVPNLYDLSIRQARTTLLASKLTVGSVLRDSMPSPYPNTITRQTPAPGDSVIVGGPVDLWISSGLGSGVTTVPQLIGEDVAEAEYLLRRSRLQFVVFEVPEPGNATPNSVVRVIPPPGSELPEGSEIRLFIAPPGEVLGPPEFPSELFDEKNR